MRFREDKPADLERARAAVARWREQNPTGTEEEMIAAPGSQFHPEYGPVLRATLFALERHRTSTSTSTGADPAPGTRPAPPPPAESPGQPPAGEVTLEEVRRQFGDRWEITPITAGYRAVIRDTGGHTPIARYGRTPGELAESIQMVEAAP